MWEKGLQLSAATLSHVMGVYVIIYCVTPYNADALARGGKSGSKCYPSTLY